jgi:hypothetical protein
LSSLDDAEPLPNGLFWANQVIGKTQIKYLGCNNTRIYKRQALKDKKRLTVDLDISG